MSAEQLQSIIDSIGEMQVNWSESTTLDVMRDDLEDLYRKFPSGIDSIIERVDACGVPADLISVDENSDTVILYLHGGGFAMGSSKSHQYLAESIGKATNAKVLLVDYRLAPDHVFPSQLDDARQSYHWLITQGFMPESISVVGDSAGGGLALALIALLAEKEESLPACVATISAWTDMRATGDSYEENASLDPVATKEMAIGMGLQYAGKRDDLDHPHLSPINMNFVGMPPLLMQVGTRDIFFSDSSTVVQKAVSAGVDATLAVWPGMIHQWPLYSSALEEGREAIVELARFLREHTQSSSRYKKGKL